jgi:L-lactate dehydrogenase complex protein LldG
LSEREQNANIRRAMLASIRQQLEASAPFDAIYEEGHAHHDGKRHTGPVIASQAPSPSSVERFRKALEAVGGQCVVVNDDAAAATAVQQIIAEMGRVAVSDSPLVRRVLSRVSTPATFLHSSAKVDLFDCQAGITGAQWAVAETGTLVLESDEERHRLASLVPPVHITLIKAEQVLETLGEVLQRVGAQGPERMSRTITFITGPSRTSDIELTLAIGVHGPAQLFVIIVEESENA